MRTGVSKAEFAGRANYHYCTGVTVSNTDVQVPVFSEEFSSIRYIERLTLVVPLNTLFLSGDRVTHDFYLFIIVTVHDNQEVPGGRTTQTQGLHPRSLIIVCI